MKKTYLFDFSEPMKIYKVEVLKGEKIEFHKHSKKREWYQIISGDGELTTGDKTYPMEIGCLYFINAGLPHQVTTKEGLIFLTYETIAPDDVTTEM